MYFKVSILLLILELVTQIQGQAATNNTTETKKTITSANKTTTPTTIEKNKIVEPVKNVITVVPKKTDNSTQKCVCDGALLPRLGENGKEVEICPHCKCKYENRNTTLIKVVVIIVIWIISILVIYMLFLMCLDPLLNKRVKANYQEHTNEDDDTTSVQQSVNVQEMSPRGANVLNRVGHQQDKWKKQVREQRRNIYDRHTMLN